MTEDKMTRGLFISHSHSDEALVGAIRRLIDDVFARHFEIFATSINPIEGGEDWRNEIRINLDRSEVVIVVITPHSFQNEWVFFEAGAAWLDSAIKEKRMIPCRFNYPDFSSTLSHIQGVDLLDSKSIETILISALSRVSGLRPVELFINIAIEEFLRVTKELLALKYVVHTEATISQNHLSTQVDQLLECVFAFFKDNSPDAQRFARMLLHRGVFINEEQFEQFVIKLETK